MTRTFHITKHPITSKRSVVIGEFWPAENDDEFANARDFFMNPLEDALEKAIQEYVDGLLSTESWGRLHCLFAKEFGEKCASIAHEHLMDKTAFEDIPPRW
jgi:hypothetical protein